MVKLTYFIKKALFWIKLQQNNLEHHKNPIKIENYRFKNGYTHLSPHKNSVLMIYSF